MYAVVMVVDGCEYVYGRYEDANRANEIAMMVRDERKIWVYVEKQ